MINWIRNKVHRAVVILKIERFHGVNVGALVRINTFGNGIIQGNLRAASRNASHGKNRHKPKLSTRKKCVCVFAAFYRMLLISYAPLHARSYTRWKPSSRNVRYLSAMNRNRQTKPKCVMLAAATAEKTAETWMEDKNVDKHDRLRKKRENLRLCRRIVSASRPFFMRLKWSEEHGIIGS